MVILSDYQPVKGSQGVSWQDGIGSGGPRCENLLGCDGVGDEVVTKVALAADGELQRWLHMCPVREKTPSVGKERATPEHAHTHTHTQWLLNTISISCSISSVLAV